MNNATQPFVDKVSFAESYLVQVFKGEIVWAYGTRQLSSNCTILFSSLDCIRILSF